MNTQCNAQWIFFDTLFCKTNKRHKNAQSSFTAVQQLCISQKMVHKN